MSLTTYKRKRNFELTPEPAGKVGPRQEKGLLYLIQKHDASRLHYDFRLELDGTLKSWAVPKGPSLDPSRKSLAVQVEDHPMEYGDFEGTIPQGQYGGGTVMLWDTGTWEPVGDAREGLRSGKLHLILHGEKLHGEWALVRMHGKAGGDGKNWLLMKIQDEHSASRDVLVQDLSVKSGRGMAEIAEGKEDVWDLRTGRVRKNEKGNAKKGDGMPVELLPQLAEPAEHPPSGEKWLHEIKFDGYRLLTFIRDGKVTMRTRTGEDWTHRFAAVAKALEDLPVDSAILDGEVVVLNAQGQSDFQALQKQFKSREKAALHYYLFDLPYHDGKDLRAMPLLERKAILKRLVAKHGSQRVQFSDHVMGDGERIIEKACAMGSEGIVSKRIDSPYESRRAATWVKSKCHQRQEFVIIGFVESEKRDGFRSILLGYHDEKNRLVYAGRAGTGFDQAMLKDLRAKLQEIEQDKPATDSLPPARERKQARWVKPELVCEVRFTGWTEDGVLRHPAFMGLRMDKSAEEVRLEKPVEAKVVKEAEVEKKRGKSTGKSSNETVRTNAKETALPTNVRLTHPEKVLYPENGITKGDLAGYYQFVAEWMLPHVVDRPLALVRCPAGLAAKCFFMRNWSETLPADVGKVQIARDETHVMIRNLAGLLSLVQISALEIHTWNCTAQDLDHPDQIIFDLDPGPDVAWKDVLKAAGTVRNTLASVHLPVFVKTSGGKGLHLTVPIKPTVTWEQAKAFCKTIAEYIATISPIFVTNMRKDLRGGKIFIDYHRNGHSATAVAPYGLRARAGAAVSMPLTWEECAKLKSAADFTLQNARRYLEQRKADPWKDFAASRVDLGYIAARTHLPQSENGNEAGSQSGSVPAKPVRRRRSTKYSK